MVQVEEPPLSDVAKRWLTLMREFRQEVYLRTQAVLYLLDGIHGHHRRMLDELNRPGVDANGPVRKTVHTMWEYPRLRGFPATIGEPWVDHTAPGNLVESLIFKMWVTEVFDLWESRFRPAFEEAARQEGVADAIRPCADVLGDLRLIRNNLLHGGAARRGQAASCGVLRWFGEGERIQVQWRHVLDFMNQMAWLDGAGLMGDGRASVWFINPQKDDTGAVGIPRLVSARPQLYPELADTRYRFGAGVVFEDGVFGNVPMGPATEEEAQALSDSGAWLRMRITDYGTTLEIPGFGGARGSDLYAHVLSREKTQGPVAGPAFKFR